ncbi:MAG: TIR domain-containing protein, partial [Ruminococcus sp.]|nr:TIR domain-containing protein [Ruminococcus sp.]
MSIFKCKMCGGTLEINNNETVGVCEYCGTKQTLPKLDDDKKINLYDRANHFRRNNDYDKAMSIYENILNEDKTDAEAYWSLVLCRYGIEYVEDPATHKRVPTVNRAQFTSVFMDEDYKSAIEYADPVQKSVYEEEAKAIDEIQKGILEISQKEEPFDVFICYKETDANGRRTQDSVLANDLYHQLTQEGFKVFFSRITLEDKLGTAYEPYIFAALNSAKVMVVIGTKPEYFNAVWVKNEWSRYLALIRNGAKKVLIPAYRDMDPYDLPEEFSHLQAQDMSKLGFMQDLIRGIRKIADAGEQKSVKKETVVVNNANTNTSPLLKRAFMFLEDGDWQSADEYCEKVLDLDPENAQAYLGKLMAQLCVKQVSMLKDYKSPFDYNNNYRKAYRFADDKLKSELEGYIKFINDRNENARLQEIYSDAIHKMNYAETENVFLEAAEMFESIEKFKDSKELAKQCREKGEEAYRNAQYNKAVSLFENPNNEADCEAAKSIFEKLGDYKDSKSYLDKYDEKVEEVRKDAVYYKAMETKNQVILDMDKKIENLEKVIQLFESVSECKDAEKQAELCRKEIEEIKAKQKALEQEKAAEEAKKKRIKKILSISIPSVIAVVVAFVILLNAVIIPNNKYNQALEYINNEDYLHANLILRSLGDYKDSNQLINEHKIDFQNYISAGDHHTVGLKSDGTVVATGYNYYGQCNVSDWSDIVAVSAGKNHTVGLKSNGTVVATGGNYLGKCDVSGWSDIVAVSAGDYHTVGLKSDGTVVATGYNLDSRCYVSGWSDIVAVSAGGGHTVGLKSDGTVVTTGKNEDGQCDVSDWSDIVAVSAGNWHTVGLKSDGTVVSTGKNDYDQRDVSYWKDIVAVSVGSGYTVGLKSDGTVVTTGENDDGQRDVSDWSDIVAVS